MNILDKICQNKKKEIFEDKKKYSINTLEKCVKKSKNRGFKNLILEKNVKKENNLIGEIKQRSPSAGQIIKNYDPVSYAKIYEKNGIGAISVLTEKKFFKGSLDDLSLVQHNTTIPILRKDFILDPYQVLQSKFYNADAILIILSILSFNQAKEILDTANKYNIDCLVEIHKFDEIDFALKLNNPIIGINNRNLSNLNINLDNTKDLRKQIPENFTLIAESGINSKQDIIEYNKTGIYNFLIGESLLKSKDISKKIKELI